MGNRYVDPLPPDLVEVAARLREERPAPTGLELDRAMLTARARAQRKAPGRGKGSLMTSRLVTTSMLVFGLVLGGTGGALGVSGLSSSGSAGEAQYAPQQGGQQLAPQSQPPAPGGVVQEDGQQEEVLPEVLPDVQVAPGDDVEGPDEQPAPQVTRQVARRGGEELPFTGFVAIPLLLAGVALLASGLVLRRRAGTA